MRPSNEYHLMMAGRVVSRCAGVVALLMMAGELSLLGRRAGHVRMRR